MRGGAKTERGRAAEKLGRIAEILCLLRLRLTGWHVAAHRLTSKRGSGAGEIDIVAKRGNILAFIEVKARGNETAALDAIGPAQRRRIANAATAYLARHPQWSGCDVRFDAMIVAGGLWPRHIPDAWRMDE